MFVRSLFKVYKPGEKDPMYGMLCYEWLCEPFKIVPSAHKNAKKRTDEPYYRTDRDVLREMSIERRHSTPEETYFSVKQRRGGATEVSSSSELPRGRRQIYDLAKKMDVPRSKVGHKKNNDFTEVRKLCADVNIPFARSITSGVRPETDDEKRRRLQKGERGNIGGTVVVEDAEQRNIQYFRCFLAENEQINLFNEACLRNKGRLQVDMTFDVAEGGYLTIASVRHPGILNKRTNRVNDVFSLLKNPSNRIQMTNFVCTYFHQLLALFRLNLVPELRLNVVFISFLGCGIPTFSNPPPPQISGWGGGGGILYKTILEIAGTDCLHAVLWESN